MLHKVSISGMTMDPESKTPIILLKYDNNEQAIPIWIGLLEAVSIASTLQNIEFERPMTHDLFKDFMDTQNVSTSKIEICDLTDNTYFAKIYFTSQDKTFSMDARPSDAIAMALRFNAPIYMDDKVLQKTMVDNTKPSEVIDTSQQGQEWADYLEKLSPEEFGEV